MQKCKLFLESANELIVESLKQLWLTLGIIVFHRYLLFSTRCRRKVILYIIMIHSYSHLRFIPITLSSPQWTICSEYTTFPSEQETRSSATAAAATTQSVIIYYYVRTEFSALGTVFHKEGKNFINVYGLSLHILSTHCNYSHISMKYKILVCLRCAFYKSESSVSFEIVPTATARCVDRKI